MNSGHQKVLQKLNYDYFKEKLATATIAILHSFQWTSIALIGNETGCAYLLDALRNQIQNDAEIEIALYRTSANLSYDSILDDLQAKARSMRSLPCNFFAILRKM